MPRNRQGSPTVCFCQRAPIEEPALHRRGGRPWTSKSRLVRNVSVDDGCVRSLDFVQPLAKLRDRRIDVPKQPVDRPCGVSAYCRRVGRAMGHPSDMNEGDAFGNDAPRGRAGGAA